MKPERKQRGGTGRSLHRAVPVILDGFDLNLSPTHFESDIWRCDSIRGESVVTVPHGGYRCYGRRRWMLSASWPAPEWRAGPGLGRRGRRRDEGNGMVPRSGDFSDSSGGRLSRCRDAGGEEISP